MTTETKQKPMSDAEFQAAIVKVGYVEAVVECARRDGYPFDEGQTRRHAEAGLAALRARGFDLTTPR